jgi:hypothetical protein
MATIDIDTETGLIRRPMRRVSGIEEVRIRAWIELITIRGEWLTDTESGLDYQAIFDGASDEAITNDVVARMSTIPNYQGIVELPTITRTNPSISDLYDIEIAVTIQAFDTPVTVSVGGAG